RPHRRVLRRRRQRQVRLPDGLHDDDAVVERAGARRADEGARARRARRRTVGRGLPAQGRHADPGQAVRGRGRPRRRPPLLGAARGHGHAEGRVLGVRVGARLRRRRRDGGRARRRQHGVQGRRPGLLPEAARRGAGRDGARRAAPGEVQRLRWRRRRRVLPVVLRLQGRAPVGVGVAALGHQQLLVPRLPLLLGGQRRRRHVQLGQQARRSARAAVTESSGERRHEAGAVQAAGRGLLLQDPARLPFLHDAVHAGRPDAQVGVRQPAVRHLGQLPAHHLRQVHGRHQAHLLLPEPPRHRHLPQGSRQAA
ncbi:hypothetical protein ACJX0J_040681, partial [Zea mays]